MTAVFLFIFGVAIGSFINVLALRYEDGQGILFTRRVQGRSKCLHCEKILCWYELIPVVSFAVQCGVCRGCKKPLRWQYPLVELVSGILTATIVPFLYQHFSQAGLLTGNQNITWIYVATGLWLLAIYTCITLAAIDLRLQLIPDQCTILLGIIAVALVTLKTTGLVTYQSFLGSYATTLGGSNSPIISALVGAGFGLLLFGGIVYLTRMIAIKKENVYRKNNNLPVLTAPEKKEIQGGMGIGDVKLAIPLGILLGWPDSLVAFAAAFVIGSIIGLLLIARRRATMKAAVPFGPFLIIGLFIAVFYGEIVARWYFSLI